MDCEIVDRYSRVPNNRGIWNNREGGGELEISPKTNNRGFGTIGGGGVKNDTIFFWYQCNKEVI